MFKRDIREGYQAMKSEARSLAIVLALAAVIPSNVVLTSTVYDPDIADYSPYYDVTTQTNHGYNYVLPENNHFQGNGICTSPPSCHPIQALAATITANAQVPLSTLRSFTQDCS